VAAAGNPAAATRHPGEKELLPREHEIGVRKIGWQQMRPTAASIMHSGCRPRTSTL
jgi:hypothetical protein